MSKEKNVLFRLLTSVKLTLALFLLLAAASVLGTVLPQGSDIFYSPWFKGLLLLLCANLVACTLDRLPKTIRLLNKPETHFDARKLLKFSLNGALATVLPMEKTRQVVQTTVNEAFGPLSAVESNGAWCAYSESGRWSRLMVHIAHLSVLVVLAGALVGSLLGFKGTMNLSQGDSSSTVMLTDGQSALKLPFRVRCDKFHLSFYTTGEPREYKSDLEVIVKGKKVLSKAILVNHPLVYQGVTFYQAQYGRTLKQAAIELTDPAAKTKIDMVLPFQQPVTIPGTHHLLVVVDYQDNFMGVGRAIELAYGKIDQQKDFSARWILVDRPSFHGNVIGKYQVRVTKAQTTWFTGLEVKKDPGVWLVWGGFILLTLAIGLTFYSSHKKLWVCIEPDEKKKKTIVTFAGRASRNPQVFEEKFKQLRTTLETRLKELPHPEEIEADKKNEGLR
ncbi:MAG: cytochrome c biogenesis protein ResB [Syntrophobacteraceae bacterium]